MSEYDEKDLAYQELLKEADATASTLSDAATEIVRLNEKVGFLMTIIEQLDFEIDTLKDFASNMFELNDGNYSLSDIDRSLDYWQQAFETAGITNATNCGETEELKKPDALDWEKKCPYCEVGL